MRKDSGMITTDGVRNQDIRPRHRDFAEKNVQIFCNLPTGEDAIHAIINANTRDGIYILNDGSPGQRDRRLVASPGFNDYCGCAFPKALVAQVVSAYID